MKKLPVAFQRQIQTAFTILFTLSHNLVGPSVCQRGKSNTNKDHQNKKNKREPPNPQTHLTPLRSPLISHSVRVSGQHLHRRRTLRRHCLPHSHSPQVLRFVSPDDAVLIWNLSFDSFLLSSVFWIQFALILSCFPFVWFMDLDLQIVLVNRLVILV